MKCTSVKEHPSLAFTKALVEWCNSNEFVPIEFTWDINPNVSFASDDRILLVMNHGGWLAIEPFLMYGLLLSMRDPIEYFLKSDLKIIINPIVNEMFGQFIAPDLFVSSKKVKENTLENGTSEGGSIVLIFPEGEAGVCKSGFTNAYQTQTFKKGFLHLAKQHERDIVVMSVVGQEETVPALGKLRFACFDQSIDLPLPSLPPFMALLGHKYQFQIHERINHNEVEVTTEYAEKIRQKVQRELDTATEGYPMRQCAELFKGVGTVFQLGFSM